MKKLTLISLIALGLSAGAAMAADSTTLNLPQNFDATSETCQYMYVPCGNSNYDPKPWWAAGYGHSASESRCTADVWFPCPPEYEVETRYRLRGADNTFNNITVCRKCDGG
jgi:hypothetical protein